MKFAPAPTEAVPTIWSARVSMAKTVPVPESSTYTLALSERAAAHTGEVPVAMVWVTVWSTMLMLLTLPLPWLTAYSFFWSGVSANATGGWPTGIRLATKLLVVVIAATVSSPKFATYMVAVSVLCTNTGFDPTGSDVVVTDRA